MDISEKQLQKHQFPMKLQREIELKLNWSNSQKQTEPQIK